jgi:hypothetical protein
MAAAITGMSMHMITRLLQLVLGCRHSSFYRERRNLHGAQVLHLVCEDCGYAVPALQRTAREHRRVVRTGAIRQAAARRRQQPAEVFAIEAQRERHSPRTRAS